MKVVDTETFIRKSKHIHGDKYDYSLVDYKLTTLKVKIICPIHDVFEQRPFNHLIGAWCSLCSDERMSKEKSMTTSNFIEKAKNVHGNKYGYSKVEYNKSSIKVIIKCKKHGFFKQRPNDHLMGKGCNHCSTELKKKRGKENPTGWQYKKWESSALKSKNFDSFKVYVIKCWDDNESFYKIGRTYRKVKKRFYCNEAMPYNYELVNEFIFKTAKEAFDYENKLKNINKLNFHTPRKYFKGFGECFYEVSTP